MRTHLLLAGDASATSPATLPALPVPVVICGEKTSDSVAAAGVPPGCASRSLSFSLVVAVDSLRRLVRPLTLLSNPAVLLRPSRGKAPLAGLADSRLDTKSSSWARDDGPRSRSPRPGV